MKYEINEDILDSSSFSEYEFESLKDEIKIMLKEINKDISYDSENMSNEEDESKENMKSDFMDESNYFAKKDNYSEKGNLILNNNSNDTKGKLNNLNNPFIKAQKNLELTEDLKQNNIKKEKQEIKNSENKFNNKPPYNFNNKEGKVLNKESILVSKEDLIDYSSDKNKHNYWYKKFSYSGKTFIQMTKNKDGKKNEYIIY